MLSFLTLENRIKNTEFISTNIYEMIKNIPNIFIYFTFCHYILAIIYALGIIFSNGNSYIFYLSLVILFVTIITNFYFNGCILTKIERKLSNNDWYGFPYTQIFKEPNTFKTNLTFFSGISGLLLFAIVKIYYRKNIN